MGFIVFFILLLIALIVLTKSIKIVPQAHAYVVERLGTYKETMDVGMHLLVPFLDHIAKKVSLKEQVLDLPPQSVITKDNVTMQIDGIVFFQITDPKLYVYAVENQVTAIENLTATTLRSVMGGMELDDTLTSRETINTKVRDAVDAATDPWGVKILRVELKNIDPPKEIRASMEKQMRAERERRETILDAEGHKESVIKRAEGDKQAKVLAAEAERDAKIALATGEAEAKRLVYEAESNGLLALKKAGADETVIKLKTIEAFTKIADGKATKLILPTEISQLGSLLGASKFILGNDEAVEEEEAPVATEDEACPHNDREQKRASSSGREKLTPLSEEYGNEGIIRK